MMSTVLYVLLFCLLGSATADFPCPQRPSAGELAFPPSEAFLPHPNYQLEWYYATGNLCIQRRTIFNSDNDADSLRYTEDFGSSDGYNCQHPVGFQLTTILVNASGGFSNSPFNRIVTTNTIAFSYDDKHYTIDGLGGAPIYPLPQLDPFDLTVSTINGASMSFDHIGGTPGQPNSMYNFIANTPNASVDLILRSQSPLMYQDHGGWSGFTDLPAGTCDSDYYVSMPRLTTSGVIRLNDEVLLVSGVTWFDHEWLTNTFNSATTSWIWSGFRIGDMDVRLTILRNYTDASLRYDFSGVTLLYANGSTVQGALTSIDVLSEWTSPLSRIIYPTHVRVHTDLAQLPTFLLTPIFADQEVAELGLSGIPQYYWEGAVKVRAHVQQDQFEEDDEIVHGLGYLELVGFQDTVV